jgi:predicted transcriptional regulator
MFEEVDYSEEAKYDLFESVSKEKSNWANCVISKLAPSYDQVKKHLEKNKIEISKKEYEKICKELGLVLD